MAILNSHVISKFPLSAFLIVLYGKVVTCVTFCQAKLVKPLHVRVVCRCQ